MGESFRALRILSIVFKVTAWIFLILIGIAAVGVSIAGKDAPAPQRFQAVVQILVEGLWRFLVLYGFGEICRVLVAIEANTRRNQT